MVLWTFILTLWILGIGGGAFAGYICFSEVDHVSDEHGWKFIAGGIAGWLICIITSSSLIVTVCRAMYFAMSNNNG